MEVHSQIAWLLFPNHVCFGSCWHSDFRRLPGSLPVLPQKSMKWDDEYFEIPVRWASPLSYASRTWLQRFWIQILILTGVSPGRRLTRSWRGVLRTRLLEDQSHAEIDMEARVEHNILHNISSSWSVSRLLGLQLIWFWPLTYLGGIHGVRGFKNQNSKFSGYSWSVGIQNSNVRYCIWGPSVVVRRVWR